MLSDRIGRHLNTIKQDTNNMLWLYAKTHLEEVIGMLYIHDFPGVLNLYVPFDLVNVSRLQQMNFICWFQNYIFIVYIITP